MMSMEFDKFTRHHAIGRIYLIKRKESKFYQVVITMTILKENSIYFLREIKLGEEITNKD